MMIDILLWGTWFGVVWWQIVLMIIYTIITLWTAWNVADEAHYTRRKIEIIDGKEVVTSKEMVSYRRGLKDTFFYQQTHFTLYDIARTIFFLPAMILALGLLLLKEGIYKFFPFLRKIFGFKLFSIEGKKEDA